MLDEVLARAAVEAGAELREAHPVTDLLWDDGKVVGVKARTVAGTNVIERARIVVGADGVHSLVAHLVQAPVLREVPPQTCGYWTYWADVPIDSLEIAYFPENQRFVVAAPTNDGLTLVAVQGAIYDFRAFRADIRAGYLGAVSLAPDLAERLSRGRQAERFRGTADLPNVVRRPRGPGWALVGDAGYHQDPILAQGILDAFRDADLLADAIDQGLSGQKPLDAALVEYEQRRDEDGMPVFERTLSETRLDPFPPDLLRLRAALRGNQPDTDRFYGAIFGTAPPQEFWAPENLARILARDNSVQSVTYRHAQTN